MSETYRIYPAALSGAVEAPASRGALRRAILAAALGGGASYLEGNILLSRETRALLDGAAALGAVWRQTEAGLEIIGLRRGEDKGRWAEKFSTQSWRLRRPERMEGREGGGGVTTAGAGTASGAGVGAGGDAVPAGTASSVALAGGGQMSPGYYIPGGQAGPLPRIDCSGAPAVLPLLLPLALARRGGASFSGRELSALPLEAYREIFKDQEVSWSFPERESGGEEASGPFLTVAGSLRPGRFTLPSGTDPLLLAGLLFALPLLKEDSSLILEQPLAGRDELDLSIRFLGDFGADVSRRQDERVSVPGRQRLQSRFFRIEGSYSRAACYLTAGALGQDVEVKGLAARSLQASRRILDFLETSGARLAQGSQGGVKMLAPAGASGSFPFLDCADDPELIPWVALAAALTPGERLITGPKRNDETRGAWFKACAEELTAIGCRITWQGQGMLVEGVEALPGGQADSRGNGEIAMLIALAASVSREPVILAGAEAAEAIWPGFWQEYRRLGGRVEAV